MEYGERINTLRPTMSLIKTLTFTLDVMMFQVQMFSIYITVTEWVAEMCLLDHRNINIIHLKEFCSHVHVYENIMRKTFVSSLDWTKNYLSHLGDKWPADKVALEHMAERGGRMGVTLFMSFNLKWQCISLIVVGIFILQFPFFWETMISHMNICVWLVTLIEWQKVFTRRN